MSPNKQRPSARGTPVHKNARLAPQAREVLVRRLQSGQRLAEVAQRMIRSPRQMPHIAEPAERRRGARSAGNQMRAAPHERRARAVPVPHDGGQRRDPWL